MKRFLFALTLAAAGVGCLSFYNGAERVVAADAAVSATAGYASVYDSLHLQGRLSRKAFDWAVEGYERAGGGGRGVLTVIDFSKPSTAERLFVIDIERVRLLCASHVSHGKGSGGLYARAFSNREGSHMSSLGFYRTCGTYRGSNGYSLRLDGLERGINDNAMRRAIVVHGADYCDPALAAQGVRLGRSFGCPAVPRAEARRIIDLIKDGTLLFIYADDADYLRRSEMVEG